MAGVRLKTIRHLIYAAAAIVLTVCLVEVGLRVYSLSCTIGQPAESHLSLTGFSWVRHHCLVPLTTYSETSALTGSAVTYQTNSRGLRGAEFTERETPDSLRILVLGDELVFGTGVTDEQTYCQLLPQQLDSQASVSAQVINAGTPGYCPLLSFLHYRHELSTLEPDLVLLHVNWSDTVDDRTYRRETRVDSLLGPLACAHPDLRSQAASNPAQSVCRELRVLSWLSRRMGSVLDDSAKTADRNRSKSDASTPDWQTVLKQMLAPIERLQQELALHSIPLLVVINPLPQSLADANSQASQQPPQLDQTVVLIQRQLASMGIKSIAVNSQLRPLTRAIRFDGRIACTLVPEGQTLMARQVAAQLSDRYVSLLSKPPTQPLDAQTLEPDELNLSRTAWPANSSRMEGRPDGRSAGANAN